jgi:hypothetical protein
MRSPLGKEVRKIFTKLLQEWEPRFLGDKTQEVAPGDLLFRLEAAPSLVFLFCCLSTPSEMSSALIWPGVRMVAGPVEWSLVPLVIPPRPVHYDFLFIYFGSVGQVSRLAGGWLKGNLLTLRFQPG